MGYRLSFDVRANGKERFWITVSRYLLVEIVRRPLIQQRDR
jgi:hypothetical protein